LIAVGIPWDATLAGCRPLARDQLPDEPQRSHAVDGLASIPAFGQKRELAEQKISVTAALRVSHASMHVVHVGKYYSPYRGGIETVVEQLCRGLVRHGIDVTVVVSNDKRSTVEERLDGVRVLRLGRSAELNSQPLNLRLVPTLRALRFDVLHFHTPNPVGALAVLAARRSEPLVVSHHSDIVRQRILGAPATAAQALLYRRAAALVAATPKHIEHSRVLRRFEAICRVIHFPIDATPYANAEATWDKDLPAEWQPEPLVLFVGRLVYYKGVEVLLDALQLAERARLAIVGVGPLREELVARSRLLGISSRVKFLGAVPEERLLSLFKRARFLVLPSVAPSEAFGMVQLEAMAAGKPVISTDLKSGVPYVNQHGITGLIVPPADPVALAKAMTTLINDEPYACRLGEGAQRRVIAEFHVDRVIDAHVELYTETLRKAPRSAF
jgi:glycosyltransferase involved in cell wall biosynthesis